jgi:2-polyprenyl-6-methoxyphenol hydroxylase-like FAD-dependent oxidoreductase
LESGRERERERERDREIERERERERERARELQRERPGHFKKVGVCSLVAGCQWQRSSLTHSCSPIVHSTFPARKLMEVALVGDAAHNTGG